MVVVRRGHPIVVVRAFLIGCVFLMVVGCAGTSSEAPQEEQGQAEATKQEQAHSPQATASEEARCDRTRTFKLRGGGSFVTNDVPGCPKGGSLSGTDGVDDLAGRDGDDKVRGLGGGDVLSGGPGSDVLYGGTGTDILEGAEGDDVLYGGSGDEELFGGGGADVIHGGDGNDSIVSGWPALGGGGSLGDGQHDKLYCGPGRDHYAAEKLDSVSNSCEVKYRPEIPS